MAIQGIAFTFYLRGRGSYSKGGGTSYKYDFYNPNDVQSIQRGLKRILGLSLKKSDIIGKDFHKDVMRALVKDIADVFAVVKESRFGAGYKSKSRFLINTYSFRVMFKDNLQGDAPDLDSGIKPLRAAYHKGAAKTVSSTGDYVYMDEGRTMLKPRDSSSRFYKFVYAKHSGLRADQIAKLGATKRAKKEWEYVSRYAEDGSEYKGYPPDEFSPKGYVEKVADADHRSLKNEQGWSVTIYAASPGVRRMQQSKFKVFDPAQTKAVVNAFLDKWGRTHVSSIRFRYIII